VKRAEPHSAAGGEFRDAALHFGGSFVRESEREDLRRRDAAFDEVRDAVSNNPRLPAAGAGQDQERPIAMRHGFALGLSQIFEKVIHRAEGGSARHPCSIKLKADVLIIPVSCSYVYPHAEGSRESLRRSCTLDRQSVLASSKFLGDILPRLLALGWKLGILRDEVQAAERAATRRDGHLFSNLQREGTRMTRIPLNRAYEYTQDLKDKLEMSTAEIGLAVRTTNCLEERGVFTVDDLLHCTREDLLSISNFGEKTLEEVYKALENVGFYRPGHQPVEV